ncbi:MAG: c-type cytochrome domain-containing protein [Verrucomicrobiota bacterium]
MNDPSLWMSLLGRFHPIVLHFPIALILLAALFELCRPFRFGKSLQPATSIIWFLAALSAVFAAIFGWFLASGGEYSGDLLERHRWLGTIVAGLAVVCWSLKWLSTKRESRSLTLGYYSLVIITVVLLTVASHDGGSMTHGKGFLTEGWTDLFETTEPEPEIVEVKPTENAFEAHIVPILEQHCVTCHGPDKSKGKLRLDTPEFMLAGGSEGPALVVDLPLESPLLGRILLDETDEDVMPPEGKKRLSPAEVAAIEEWLALGARFDLPSSAMESSPVAVVEAVAETEAIEILGTEPGLSHEVIDGLLRELESAGFVARFISQESMDVRIEVGLARPTIDARDIELIGELGDHVIDLDLSRTDLSDLPLEPLSRLSRLRRLNLSGTGSNDEVVLWALRLPTLEYLNLYGNPDISDASVGLLATLPDLKQLYLWQTKVSPDAADLLVRASPHLNLDLSSDHGVAGESESSPSKDAE